MIVIRRKAGTEFGLQAHCGPFIGSRLAHYLVTGGAGFIGSHISEALVTRGHRVRVADNFITGYRQNLRDGVEFMEGDCADPAFARAIVAGMDYVIHQAAIPDRKSTRLNSSHSQISYAVFCLK